MKEKNNETRTQIMFVFALVIILVGGFTIAKVNERNQELEKRGELKKYTYYDAEKGWSSVSLYENEVKFEILSQKNKHFDMSPYEDRLLGIARENLDKLVNANSNKLKLNPVTTPGFNSRKNYIKNYGHEPEEYWTFNPDDLFIKRYDFPDYVTYQEEKNEFGETYQVEVVHEGGLRGIVFGLPISNGQVVYTYWRIDMADDQIGIINGEYLSLPEHYGYPEIKTNYVFCNTDGSLKFDFMFRSW